MSVLAAALRPVRRRSHPLRAGPWAQTERESGMGLSADGGVEAWMTCRQPARHPTSPPLALGVTGLRGPPRAGPLCLGPQALLPPRSHFPPPPPPLSPKRACTSDIEVGPSTPTGSKQQTALTIAGSGCPSSGQESGPRAGGAAACLSPCTAAVADLGRGVWRGRAPPPPRRGRVFPFWSRESNGWCPPPTRILAEGGCGRGPAPSQLIRCLSTPLLGEGSRGKMLEANGGKPTCVQGLRGR